MKKTIILAILFACFYLLNAQQIGEGISVGLEQENGFNYPLKSGIYTTNKNQNQFPFSYTGHEWKYLFVLRHNNMLMNQEFQIATNFVTDNRVFFRKVETPGGLASNDWHEFATRGSNSFKGNQFFEGSVGIGTTSSDYKLEVRDGEFAVKCSAPDNITNSNTAMVLINRGRNGLDYAWKMFTAAVGGGYGVNPNAYEIWEYPNGYAGENCCRQRFVILPSENANEITPFILNSSGKALIGYSYTQPTNNDLSVHGNVGIGTIDSKGYKLAVNGTIRAQEIKIEAGNWPDYVFSSSYKLQSLSDVEKYIQENNHLPNIPSEQEVKEEGISVGEMNAKLLQKIEEMTLYMIQMQKEIDELKKTDKP